MYSIFGKPLKRAFQKCMGHGRVGVRQKKLFKAECQGFGDFQRISSCPGLGGLKFSAPITPKTLEPGETKARNGFRTLNIGGSHVVGHCDPPLSTRRPPGRVLTCKLGHGPWSMAPPWSDLHHRTPVPHAKLSQPPIPQETPPKIPTLDFKGENGLVSVGRISTACPL